jgi:hypothetical protein
MEALSEDSTHKDAISSFNRLLAWMIAVGRARLLYWDDHGDIEKCWIELLFPLSDGQWAHWDAGLTWDEQSPSIISDFVDMSRPLPGVNLSLDNPDSALPRTFDGWLWQWANLREWLADSYDDNIDAMLAVALDPRAQVHSPGLRIGAATRAKEATTHVEGQHCTEPSRELRAYLALHTGPTYLGMTEALREFRHGTNEYAWSPWGVPANAVGDDTDMPESIDFVAISQLARKYEDATDDWDAYAFVTSIMEPVVIAYPGTPAWLLSELIDRAHQPQLLSCCAIIPDESRALFTLSAGSEIDSSIEVITTPGTLLGPAKETSPPPTPEDHALLVKISAIQAQIGAMAMSTTDSPKIRALCLLVNSPLWAMAVAIKDGWIGAMASEDASVFSTDLDGFTATLAYLGASDSTSPTVHELEQLHDSVRQAWLGLGGFGAGDG